MPVTLFHGDNILEINEAVRAMRAGFHGADVLTLDGPATPLPQLSEACRTAGLFAEDRLVIVERLEQRYKAAAEAESIAGIIGDVAPQTSLLLVSPDLAGDHKLVRDVRGAGGKVRAFASPRRQDLIRWITGRGPTRGVTIERDAAEGLAELIGNNTLMLDSEIEKLATYASGEQRVTRAMVDELVGAVSQDSVFKLVDAVTAGNIGLALRLLHRQLETATSTPIDVALTVIRLVARQMRILLRIQLFQAAGRSNVAIIDELKLSRYYADGYFNQARRLPRERVTASFERLAAFEHALKSGKADPATGLDLLVAQLCS